MKYKSSFEEIWDARQKIFEKCHNNPKELIEYYIALQKERNIVFEEEELPIINKKKSKKNKLKKNC